jgi:excisionase family DNA binding protein
LAIRYWFRDSDCKVAINPLAATGDQQRSFRGNYEVDTEASESRCVSFCGIARTKTTVCVIAEQIDRDLVAEAVSRLTVKNLAGLWAMNTKVESDNRLETQVYGRRDLADLLGVSERHVDRLTATGNIPGVFRVGRLVRYRRVIIDRWLAGEETAT